MATLSHKQGPLQGFTHGLSINNILSTRYLLHKTSMYNIQVARSYGATPPFDIVIVSETFAWTGAGMSVHLTSVTHTTSKQRGPQREKQARRTVGRWTANDCMCVCLHVIVVLFHWNIKT